MTKVSAKKTPPSTPGHYVVWLLGKRFATTAHYGPDRVWRRGSQAQQVTHYCLEAIPE